MVKRKKHDKDKYYNLARQQGYRARSAFKLIQLNKKYDFLSTAKVCIDLCAAPGGWCQVAAKYMPASSIIIGIDLLPIRPIRGVKTFQCDITTAKCRQIIKQETQSWQVDVVLCDGAPNVGAEYAKDAYVQNELALIALKLAVDVMGRGATFVSKVFRSQDYNALLWVFKQFFKKVSATKPLSSRNESAEIFVVCEQYLAPHSIDPKLFDPKFVFDQLDSQEKSITIFHPKFGVQKRHREGYDEALGQTLTNECSVAQFLDSSDPIRLLTDTTAIRFRPTDDVYRDHPATTEDVAVCLKDLKVLGKSDFKMLLKWRLKMLKYKEELLKAEAPAVDEEELLATQAAAAADAAAAKEPEKELTEEEKNALIREELAQLRANLLAKKKREKKKDREQKRKLRIRQALGMNEQGIDVADGAESAFSLKELNLSKAQVDLLENAGPVSDDDDEDREGRPDSDTDLEFESDDDEYTEVLDSQMEKLYDEYLSRKGDAVKTKKAIKRSKVAKRAIAGEALTQDAEMYDGDREAYHKMIRADESSDDSDDDDEEDTSGKLNVALKFKEKPNAAVSRWFSDNQLFAGVDNDDDDDVAMDDAHGRKKSASAIPEMPKTDKQIRKDKRKAAKDRQERRERKRIKKDEEQYEMEFGSEFTVEAAKGDDGDDEDMDDEETGGRKGVQGDDMDGMDKTTVSDEVKALIRSGMGAALKASSTNDKSSAIEVVPAAAQDVGDGDEQLLPVLDDRQYDSDHEEYDAEDRAKTLALATMMVRKTNAKDMVDASYNRYAWNDSSEMPDWFVDDEEKHYRPQVPIPQKLFEQMKERFMAMATKPIKKVAEARGRKQRQQLKKLKVAKKKAADIANLPDMSTREKLKAIDRAMKGAKLKKEQKVYVISRRGGRSSTAQSAGKKPTGKVKLVDSRMRKDKRNADIKEKRGRKKKR